MEVHVSVKKSDSCLLDQPDRVGRFISLVAASHFYGVFLFLKLE